MPRPGAKKFAFVLAALLVLAPALVAAEMPPVEYQAPADATRGSYKSRFIQFFKNLFTPDDDGGSPDEGSPGDDISQPGDDPSPPDDGDPAYGFQNKVENLARAALINEGEEVTPQALEQKSREVLALRSQGMGWGEIAHELDVDPESQAVQTDPNRDRAENLARAALIKEGEDVTDDSLAEKTEHVLQMRESGMGWGKIASALGVESKSAGYGIWKVQTEEGTVFRFTPANITKAYGGVDADPGPGDEAGAGVGKGQGKGAAKGGGQGKGAAKGGGKGGGVGAAKGGGQGKAGGVGRGRGRGRGHSMARGKGHGKGHSK